MIAGVKALYVAMVFWCGVPQVNAPEECSIIYIATEHEGQPITTRAGCVTALRWFADTFLGDGKRYMGECRRIPLPQDGTNYARL